MTPGAWPTESREGWIVVGATFVTLGMVYGVWYSYSVFLVAFLREFGWSRSLLAGAFSTFVIVHGVLGPLNGWLAGRVGPRRIILVGGGLLGVGLVLVAETQAWWHLYAAFGGVVALGVACAGWVPSIILVRSWFPHRVGTALGVASAGIGIGITGIVPLAQILVASLGWRWAYRILGGLVMAWIIPATLWLVREPPVAMPPTASGRLHAASSHAVYWTLATAVRDWHFWGLAAVFFSGTAATQMLMVHQVAYLVDHGVAALVAAAVAGMVGLVSIPGKVGWGTLSDRVNREVAYSLAFACVVGAIVALVLAGRYPASAIPYVYATLIGLGYAATAPLTPAAASDLFSGPKFSTIFGTLHISNALGASTGAWIGGRIFDHTGTYLLAFGLALVMAVFSASLLWIVAPRRPHPPPT
jgi:MFS family permease